MNPDEIFLKLAPKLEATRPAANYTNAVRSGNLLFLAGKIAQSTSNGKSPKGILGRDFNTAEGYQFDRSAALDLLSAVRDELGSLNKVARIVKLNGFLRADENFEEHPKVLDGASDLMVKVFGERGIHARSVLGAISLRGGTPIVLEGIIEVM